MAVDQNQVRPNYGPQPKGKANIMRQGQTEADAFGQNPMNQWLNTEYRRRNNNAPPDFFVAGGFAAASAVFNGITRAGGTDTERLIAAMEGMTFDTPKGQMTFRREDHQAPRVSCRGEEPVHHVIGG